MQPSPSDDYDLARALLLIEKLRPQLNANDGGAYAVCRDAALEAGFLFQAKRCRAVPVKKSNPGIRWAYDADGKRQPRPLTSRRRYIDRGRQLPGAARVLAGLAGMPLRQAERPIGESYHLPIDMGLRPEYGFTYAGDQREAIRGENANLFGIDATSAQQWVAGDMLTLPRAEGMRIGAADLTFDDHDRHVEQHRLVLASNPTRQESPWQVGEWYGQRWLNGTAPRWPWESDKLFGDLLEEEQSDLRDAWSLREAINAPPRIEIRSSPFVPDGTAYLFQEPVMPGDNFILPAPRPKPPQRRGPPAFLPQRRLDGRKR